MIASDSKKKIKVFRVQNNHLHPWVVTFWSGGMMTCCDFDEALALTRFLIREESLT